MEIIKIVITGGPCAGKSVAMNIIKETFTKQGYVVLFVPETATELITGGVCPWTTGTNLDYQICQCKLQAFKENIFHEAISTMPQDKFLLVCDRGMFDNRAYMTQEEFEICLQKLNTTEEEVNKSYDAIFHLETAAKGLQQYYSLESNVARYETVEEAAALDDRLLQAWANHPNHIVIQNNENFDLKMDQLINEISKFLK